MAKNAHSLSILTEAFQKCNAVDGFSRSILPKQRIFYLPEVVMHGFFPPCIDWFEKEGPNMEQTLQSPQVYDFRQHDRIWQRVAPQLEPFPELRQQPAALSATGEPTPQAPASSSPAQLPGADPNPCCMGSAAAEMLGVLTGFVEESLSDRHQLLSLARHAPQWARQTLRDMAADEAAHARRLMAVYYLITGGCYRPAVSYQSVTATNWCAALRERYHTEACNGLNFARSAESTTDPCLRALLNELSAEEYRHAEQLLILLERSLRP